MRESHSRRSVAEAQYDNRYFTQPDSERKIVLVTHDESCFSSNDGRKTIWLDQDHNILRPKGEGRSIMVSAFLCECHGLL